MKRQLVLTCGSALFVVGAACAGGEEASDEPTPTPDSGVIVGDSTSSDAPHEEPSTDAATGCSAAGWCATELPESNITLKDIWVLPGHAFAIAESPTRGVKTLEWMPADSKWVYIDDNSQNESSPDVYAGKIWAASADEVYFTVSPRTIYHGRRQSLPSPGWAWTHQQLEDRAPAYPAVTGDHYRGRPTFAATKTTYTALGVFGIGADDVYAWYANAIYHSSKDADGNESWDVEYVADDRDNDNEQLFFIGATAANKDDVWFAGGRGARPEQNGCPILVHKTAAGYRRVADGVPAVGNTSTIDGGISFPDGGIITPPDGGISFPDGGIITPPDGGIITPPDGGIITPPDGGLSLDGGFPTLDAGSPGFDAGFPILDGGITLPDSGISSPDGGTVASFNVCNARAQRILLGSAVGWLGSAEAIGPQQVVLLKGGREVVKVALSGNDYKSELTTLPTKPSNGNFVSLWTASNDSIWLGGQNIILRGSQDLTDGGTYEVSTISLTGGWLETPIYQIRGSSNVDRWAVGVNHALHKTTP